MPSTDSFTSTATATSVGTVGKLVFNVGTDNLTPRGFRVLSNISGITVTKASTFGGSQNALAFPLTRADALELAQALLEAN